jgi:D-serine deaminase-like pyridoxal phosphate-dependent protein
LKRQDERTGQTLIIGHDTRFMGEQFAAVAADIASRKGFAVLQCTQPVPTPTISHADDLTGVDEVRPGNYILYDAFQATIGSCSFDDCALTILAAIVHRGDQKIIIDAGAIALSKDRGPVDRDPGCGYGRVLDLYGVDLGLRVAGVSQEHGVIPVADKALLNKLKVGDRVRVLANHSCISAAQHTHYNVLENGEIVDKWQIHRGW